MQSLTFIVQALPALLALALLLVLVQVLTAPGRPLARWVPPAGGRLESVDGLRGYLALGVVLCHIATFQALDQGQPWGPHANPYFRQAGAAAVRLFFMITGFLFWTKALRSGGHLPALRLYANRFWRIMPLYLALVAVLALWSLVIGDGLLKVPAGQAALELLSLLPPGFFPDVVLNGYDTIHVLRQAWTLRWEWLYYLCLPLLALGLRSRWHAAALVLALAASGWLLDRLRLFNLSSDWSVLATFGIGMGTAWLVHRRPALPYARSRLAHLLGAAAVVLTPLLIHSGGVIAGNLIYGALFVLIVYGNSLFGLLHLRASRLLGEVSYSIYLLHMVVLGAWMALLQTTGHLPEPDHLRYWVWMAPSLVGVAGFSLLTFLCIERPGIAQARRASQSVR